MEDSELKSISAAVAKEIAALNAAEAEKISGGTETFDCTECGGAVVAMAKFCPHCGEELEWAE